MRGHRLSRIGSSTVKYAFDMRKLIVSLLIVAAISPFAAIFLGPLLTGRPDASLYFFPLLGYAMMIALPLVLALVAAPANDSRAAAGAPRRGIRHIISALLVAAGLVSPWWWPLVGGIRQGFANRGKIGMLREVCSAKARDVTNRQVTGVNELDIRLPRWSALRDPFREPWAIETSLHSRDTSEETWSSSNLGPARFERIVIEQPTSQGGFELHGPARNPRDNLSDQLASDTVLPRYQLSWDYIQNIPEQRSGLIGVHTQIKDTVKGDVLAERTTYFLRKDAALVVEGEVNPMYDSCDNAVLRRDGRKIMFIDNSFDWVRRVLKP